MAKSTNRQLIRTVLFEARGRVSLYSIQHTIAKRYNHWISDATISAEIRRLRRELRDEGWALKGEPAEGKKYHLYWVEKIGEGAVA